MSDYDRLMTSEIAGLIRPIGELGSAGSAAVSVVATRDARWDARAYLEALVRFPTIGRSIVPGSQLYTADGQPWPAHE